MHKLNQSQASTFEVYVCPIGHKDLCLQKWKNKFIDHWIICKCPCHSSGKVDLHLPKIERERP
jgi:hypothetical protein